VAGLSLGLGWGWVERPMVGNRLVQPAEGKEVRSGDAQPAGLPDPLEGPGKKPMAMLERIATASREDLVRLTREVLSGKNEFYLNGLIWKRWLEVDAEGGFRALLAGEFGGEERMPVVRQYLEQWAIKDPETAIVRALSLPEKCHKGSAISQISSALAAHRPADFFRLYPELAKWPNASDHTTAAAANLAATDPGAMAALLKNPQSYLPLNEEARDNAWRGLATGWGRTDPAAAAAWFRELENPRGRALGLNEIAKQVITKDPAQAAELIRESVSLKMLAPRDAAMALAVTDPEAALTWLEKEFPVESPDVAGEVAFEHIPRTAQAAVDYLVQHAGKIFSGGKIQRGYTNWSLALDDPAAALSIAGKIQDAGTLSNVRTLLLDVMARRLPQEALAAATPGEEQNQVMGTAVGCWAKQDLTAATTWLAAQPAGGPRDEAINNLLNVTLRVEPESALPWAAAVSESSSRIAAYGRVLRATGAVEQEAAVAALQSVAASPGDIDQVLHDLKPRNPEP